jgi:hypothetical protein
LNDLPGPGPRRVQILHFADLFKGSGIKTTDGIGIGWQTEPEQTKETETPVKVTHATMSFKNKNIHNNLFYENL